MVSETRQSALDVRFLDGRVEFIGHSVEAVYASGQFTPAGITLVGDTDAQLGEKSRHQKASH
jgi:hypothetical protein